jgi:hypothetical protein
MKVQELFEAKSFVVKFQTGRFSRKSELTEPRLHALKIMTPAEHKAVDKLEVYHDLSFVRHESDEKTIITITRTR